MSTEDMTPQQRIAVLRQQLADAERQHEHALQDARIARTRALECDARARFWGAQCVPIRRLIASLEQREAA